MERMPNGEGAHLVDAETEHIRLVSLGNHCGPKLSFKHLGRGAETLPFDWSRTRLKGIMHYMTNNFSDFFHFVHSEQVPGIPRMTMYRDRLHSFWHDNPTDEGMREKYTRRFERFNTIDAKSGPVLFVRVGVMKSEVEHLKELLDELRQRFGPQAHLLFIFTTQDSVKGPILIDGLDGLLIYYMPRGALGGGKGYTVYAEPVACALHWMIGRSTETTTFESAQNLLDVTNELPSGLEGLGGLRAFEPDEEDEAVNAAVASMVAAAAAAPAQASTTVVSVQPLRVVSLGHYCGVQVALQSLGLANSHPLPFDWLNSRLEGVMRFIKDDFDGFLDTAELEKVEYDTGGAPGTALRGREHAFWYDCPSDDATFAEQRSRIQSFRSLDANAAPVLFVRIAAVSSSEVAQAGELLSALQQRVGRQAHLLLILDNQQTAAGAGLIENQKNLLLYYLSRNAAAESTGDLAAVYAEPIRTAMSWVRGEGFAAMHIPNLETAATFVDEDCTGLCGLGGLGAFKEG
eukprot:TRINITY_DN55095_c0_g1_i1.p1 TRINITY_DN55095_c0_g1~~TRINITY_DN55095_c0_g1_i1.p1  ORF type:complete len:561 (-),score=97.42 TRINITY_DN55095_c0_g1_i1:122-1669(-)